MRGDIARVATSANRFDIERRYGAGALAKPGSERPVSSHRGRPRRRRSAGVAASGSDDAAVSLGQAAEGAAAPRGR
jgi:hypothetical protein